EKSTLTFMEAEQKPWSLPMVDNSIKRAGISKHKYSWMPGSKCWLWIFGDMENRTAQATPIQWMHHFTWMYWPQFGTSTKQALKACPLSEAVWVAAPPVMPP